MLYNYAFYLGKDMSVSADITGFKDASLVHTWGAKEMAWAVGTGIIQGKYSGTLLDPQGFATRAETATMMMRFMENL